MTAPAHNETIVISVGGSLIVPPDGVDTEFLANLKALVIANIAGGRRFVIIAGGGRTARAYQEAGRAVSSLTPEDLDWLGIHATRLNAHLLRSIFRDVAHPTIIKDPTAPIDATESLIIAAGWKPGWSTDYDAVLIAKNLGARTVVNMSNIDTVYTADPRKDPTAKPISTISWKDFRKLLPEDWDPGLSSPFDPVAAREAETLGLEVAVISGKKLPELQRYLDGEPFTGTRIH